MSQAPGAAPFALFLGALAIRLLHLQQIRVNDPFFDIPAVDGRLYHAWAQQLAGGDLLGEGVLILGPLYPHLMGLLYAITGPNLFGLKLLQCILGAATCVLVWKLAADLFDRRVALVAGFAASLYGMLIFYGGTVMIVNVQLPLVLGSLILVVRALRAPTRLAFFAAGIVLGLSALARQTVLLFVPALMLWIVYALRFATSLRARSEMAAALALAVGLLILPFTIRNYVVAGDLVLINSVGGANLYMGNYEGANGAWKPPPIARGRVDNPLAMRAAFTSYAERETGRKLLPSEVSSFWTGKALDYIASSPGEWLALEGRKLLLFLNAGEIWNNRSITISREFSWVLRAPLLSLGVALPFALLGLLLSAPRWRELFPIHAMIAVYLVTALTFFVLSRYRMPIVPLLLILAAHAAVWLYDAIRARDLRRCALGLVAIAAFAALSHTDTRPGSLFMAYYNLGNKYNDRRQYDLAIESYRKSLAISPAFISSHNNMALALEASGKSEEAAEAWRVVLALAERADDARRRERAVRHLEALGETLEPDVER